MGLNGDPCEMQIAKRIRKENLDWSILTGKWLVSKANLMNMCFKLSELQVLKWLEVVFNTQVKCHHMNNSF
jgi:hypothetical protein